MIPNEESVKNAKEKLDMVYNGKKLESSYGEVGNVQNPGNVDAVLPEEPTTPEETPSEPELPTIPENNGVEEPDDNKESETNNSPESNDEPDNNEGDDILEDHIQDVVDGSSQGEQTSNEEVVEPTEN